MYLVDVFISADRREIKVSKKTIILIEMAKVLENRQ